MLSVDQVLPRIYCLATNHYDLAMLFLRYQEYYESDNNRFFRRKFTIAEFMSAYTKLNNSIVFDYPDAWAGFNVPVPMIDAVFALGIEDFNFYDHLMKGIVQMIKNDSGTNDCYLIGVDPEGEAFGHELAHGLYYTNEAYRAEISRLFFVFNTDHKNHYQELERRLIKTGYAASVIQDELHAYTVDTDVADFWLDAPSEMVQLQTDVRRVFEKYGKDAKPFLSKRDDI